MEVNILHRHHLGIAAAGGAPLDAKHGAKRGLPQGHHGPLADMPESVPQAYGGGGLPLPGGGGGDGRHQNQLPVGSVRQILQQAGVHFGLVPAVGLYIPLING